MRTDAKSGRNKRAGVFESGIVRFLLCAVCLVPPGCDAYIPTSQKVTVAALERHSRTPIVEGTISLALVDGGAYASRYSIAELLLESSQCGRLDSRGFARVEINTSRVSGGLAAITDNPKRDQVRDELCLIRLHTNDFSDLVVLKLRPGFEAHGDKSIVRIIEIEKPVEDLAAYQ